MPATKLNGIAACVFDAYGTLFDVHSAAARCRDALGPKCDAVSQLWRQKQLEYTWLRSLMGRHEDFWQVTSDALDFALAAHAIDDPDLRARLMQLYLGLDAYPDAAPALARLRESGMKTAILSNGSPTMLTAAVKSAGLTGMFDAVLSVEAVQIFKPHPTVYQIAVDSLDLPAPAIAFLSSNGWDIAGAAVFGLHTIWVNRTGNKREVLPGKPSVEVATLADVPRLVGP
jgi:2-haloacid dehalogenase